MLLALDTREEPSFHKFGTTASCLHRASMTIKHFIIQLVQNI